MSTTLAKNLVTARELRGLDQKGLARLAGVSQTTISDLERGRNESSRKLPQIAKTLGFTVEELLSRAFLTNTNLSQKKSQIAIDTPPKFKTIAVKSLAQIINNEQGSGIKMIVPDDLPSNLVGFILDTDQMHGFDGRAIEKGSYLAINQEKEPETDDIVLAAIGDDSIIGHYRKVAGKPMLKPSNSRYQMFDITDAKIIGVVELWLNRNKPGK